MRRKKTNKISLKFIFFLLVILSVIVFYISQPSDNKKINKSKTFEEMLEYSNTNSTSKIKEQEDNRISEDYEKENKVRTSKQIQYIPQKQIEQANYTTANNYDRLLDSLSEYPAKSISSATNIVNKLLVYKGYPQNCLRVVSSDIDQSKSKTEGSYQVANFDFSSGNMYISSKMLYELDTKVLIAIIAHELDHFDKLVKVCKYMGLQQFKQLLEDNKIKNIDVSFWSRASMYANLKDFNGEYYQKALTRFITQNDLELTSSYSDFYRLSENIRNPLEISAYAESDYVYRHFNIPIEEGPMKILIKKFNDVDWGIYNTISQNPLIKEERIAIFDYFFLEAIITRFPDLQSIYNECRLQKNGDLTAFWYAFENNVRSFYQKGEMDKETYNKMLNILTITESKIRQGITDEEIATALKYKINTLFSNLVYPNALKNLEKTTINYLKYIKEKNINDAAQELKCILILINMENEITTTNPESKTSLYYINIPESLTKIYKVADKRQMFINIYNNPAFKSTLEQNQTEQKHLEKLLAQNKLDIRINN